MNIKIRPGSIDDLEKLQNIGHETIMRLSAR